MYIKRIILVLIIILSFVTGVYAFRFKTPTKITKFDDSAMLIINDALQDIWNLSNGRFSLDIVTINPDGSKKGDVGDILLFNDSGTYYLCVNVTGAKVWRSEALSDTP